MPSVLTAEQALAFERDGYVFVRGFYSAAETDLLRKAMEQDPAISAHMYNRGDAEGAVTRMVTWNEPGDSVYGLASRAEKMVDTMEHLLGGEVYHYHSKLTAKEPFEGGAWEWHQDYGYWYNNGCLFPYMASAMIALDPCTQDNGCLQVLRASHLMGRIDHGLLDGDQVGADLVRVNKALEQLELVYCIMAPGDALFFHCNTLHRSDQNRSPNRRWTILNCYNAARNNPYKTHHHASYKKIDKVPDTAILAAGLKFYNANQQDAFLKKATAPADLKTKGGATFSNAA
jgi:ectoine hydroxylase